MDGMMPQGLKVGTVTSRRDSRRRWPLPGADAPGSLHPAAARLRWGDAWHDCEAAVEGQGLRTAVPNTVERQRQDVAHGRGVRTSGAKAPMSFRPVAARLKPRPVEPLSFEVKRDREEFRSHPFQKKERMGHLRYRWVEVRKADPSTAEVTREAQWWRFSGSRLVMTTRETGRVWGERIRCVTPLRGWAFEVVD